MTANPQPRKSGLKDNERQLTTMFHIKPNGSNGPDITFWVWLLSRFLGLNLECAI